MKVLATCGLILLVAGCAGGGGQGRPADAADSEASAAAAAEGQNQRVAGEDASELPKPRALCESTCAVTDQIPCPDRRPDCVDRCLLLFAGGGCHTQLTAMLACRTPLGPEHYSCDGEKTRRVTTACESEVQAWFDCVKPKPPPGG